MNSLSDNTDTVFSLDFHVGEKSEGVRQSDFRVQIVPASGSPSRAERSSNGCLAQIQIIGTRTGESATRCVVQAVHRVDSFKG